MPKHTLTHKSLDEIPVITAANVSSSDYELLFDASANQFVKRASDTPGRYNVITSTATTLTLTSAHYGSLIRMNAASGNQAVTLPSSSGSGGAIEFVITTAVGGGTLTITSPGSDRMQGRAITTDDTANLVEGFEDGGDANTFTLNGTTTGGLVGDTIKVIDISSGRWQLNAVLANTGTPSTPWSKV
jgi:hypothetical protein